MKIITDIIIDQAKSARARIAIGADPHHAGKVIESAQKAEEFGYADVTIVSPTLLETGIRQVVSPLAAFKLVELLKERKVDGIVRGSIDVNPVMAAIHEQFKVPKLLRLALLKTPDGTPFFFAPVGIDDGWELSEKLRLGILGTELMRKFGIQENIAVLGGGRKDDTGRSRITDKSIQDAEKITDMLTKEGCRAKCMYIEIEQAVGNFNFILAPDGISGNLIYRSLCLIGGAGGMGGPAVGIDFVYVDTSRAGIRYENAICFASALAGIKNQIRR